MSGLRQLILVWLSQERVSHACTVLPLRFANMMRLFSSGPSGSVPSTAPAGPSQAPVPTVVVLGMTGDGKSNLSTWLLGNPNVFRVSDSAESCTEEPLAAVGNCFGKYASYDGKWQVVDTPGLSDSAGRDAQNLRSTVALLKNKVKQATAFILVVNAQQDRMSAALKNTIRVFRGCFGPSLWANLCVVFTKWDWAKRHGGFTVDKLNQRRAEWNKWFLKCEVEYNGLPDAVSGAEIQFFAVDLPSLALVLQDGGDEEVEDMLLETSKSGLASTGEQIRMLYNHIYIVLAAKTPVNMLLAEAKTEQLHEEIAARLKEEKAERARQVWRAPHASMSGAKVDRPCLGCLPKGRPGAGGVCAFPSVYTTYVCTGMSDRDRPKHGAQDLAAPAWPLLLTVVGLLHSCW